MQPLLCSGPASWQIWSVFVAILAGVAFVDTVHGYWMTHRLEHRRLDERVGRLVEDRRW